MLRFMLDTDIASYIMKRSSPLVLSRLQSVPPSAVCISAITCSELRFGVETSQRRKHDSAAVEAFLAFVQVLDYPAGAADDYAKIRAVLKARGTMIGGNDLFIAAHARHLSLTLATNNTREFGRVPGLRIENWTQPNC